ncbi:MAG: transporter substrate-binding domain-containing protein [Polyangiaceae bacterium]
MRLARLVLLLMTLVVMTLRPAWAADGGVSSRALAGDAAVGRAASGEAGAADDEGAGDASVDGGATDDDTPRGPRLRVGVAGDPPFVVERDEDLTGIAVELFREAAKESHLEFDMVKVETVPEGLLAVQHGDIDVLVGDVSITAARVERMRFSQPYFRSSLGVATMRSETASFASKLTPFFSKSFFAATAVLLAVLCGVGTLVWLVERKKNPEQFPVAPARGIANGVWFALVTMTTVGYGDRAPVTPLGRIISGVWMVIALITASSLTAGIATALTLASLAQGGIENIDQLAREKVAVVSGTPAVDFAKQTRVRVVPVENMEEGIEKLMIGEVKGVLFDKPQLIFFAREHPDKDIVVSRASYQPQGYGFALPLETQHQHALNLALLRLAEQGFTHKVVIGWLGPDGEQIP